MPNKFENGALDAPQEKTESTEKSKFEELATDAKERSLEGSYTGAVTEEDEKKIHQESMRGAYLESDNPEKIAMFKLREAKDALDSLAMVLNTLEKWDGRQKKLEEMGQSLDGREEKKKKWEEARDERITKLNPILSELGLAIPQTAEEAKTLDKNIVNSGNWQKLVEKYKKEK